MKITIEHYDEIYSLEVSDEFDIEIFQGYLESILKVMWLPEQVEEILGINDYEKGYKEGYEEGMHTVSPSPIRRPVPTEQPRDALGKILCDSKPQSNPS
jgi:hypothetical protein